MVDIQSKEVIDKISDDLKVQPSLQIPRELAKQIQLSYNVNPNRIVTQIINSTIADSTGGQVGTASSTRDTFVVAALLSVSKDVVSTSIRSAVTITLFESSTATTLLQLLYEPVTANNHQIGLNFSHPIKLARGSAIGLINSTAIASIDTRVLVYMYETDPQ